MAKIVSFGDSFIFGSELQNNPHGKMGWPGLAADRLGVEYVTRAKPGCGNDHIARQIYSWFSNNSSQDTLAVINWTWLARWDFYVLEHDTWITLGPSCVPEWLKHVVEQTEAQDMIGFYKKRINNSVLWNKNRNLQIIASVQSYLKSRNIKNIQTYMDYDLLDQVFHAPDYIMELQSMIQPDLQLFEGKNFLDWSHDHGYPVTIEGMHPLEQAHNAAAEYWKEIYKHSLNL